MPVAVAAAAGAIFGTIAAGVAAYKAVIELAATFERSVTIEVKNATDERLRVEGLHHSSGEFATRPPAVIEPRQSAVFSSRSTAGVGAVGNLRLVSSDLWLGMSWHNPVIGSNEFRSSENGARAGEFLTNAIARSGNHAAFEYTIGYRDPARVQMMLRSLTVGLFSGIPGGFSANPPAVGHEADGTPLFLGRARHGGGVHPGKARRDWQSVAISYGGAELWPSAGAEVWTGRVPNGSGGVWLRPDRAHNALVVGEESDGTPLFAARMSHAGGRQLGKWRRDWSAASVSYAGNELWLGDFEVLCVR